MDIESFNPHTHAGCDFFYLLDFLFGEVSIHTPTQGVTISRAITIGTPQVSIHTPTQGVTELIQ